MLKLIGFDLKRQLGGAALWWALAVVLALFAWAWFSTVDHFLHLQASDQTNGSVTATVVAPAMAQCASVLLLLIALLALRAYAEERRLGTATLLQMAPLSEWKIVVAKWLGAALIPGLVLVLSLVMIATLAIGADLDWGRIIASAIGLMGLILAGCALTLAISILLVQPLAVLVTAAAVLLGLWFIDLAPLQRGVTDSGLRYISMAHHFRPFLAGVVKLSSAAYFLGLTLWALWLGAMALRHQSRLRKLLSAALGLLVLLGLLLLAHRFERTADWTSTGSNSISPTVIQLMRGLDGPVEASVYASNNPRLRRTIANFLGRFKAEHSDWTTRFIDPAADPELIRRLNIRSDGELRLKHNGGEEILRNLSEQSVANALLRLARPGDVFVAYSYGSGERDLRGAADFDLGSFGNALGQRGVEVSPIDLLLTPQIPENLDLLIVTQPRTELLPGLGQSIRSYVQAGGNLLWLADPGSLQGLDPLLDEFRIQLLPGTLVDASAPSRGEDPFAPVMLNYGGHPAVRDFAMRTLFPRARAWLINASQWNAVPLVLSSANSWNETGDLLGELGLDMPQEQRGPLPLAVALSRSVNSKEQRAAVFGDGDFLSNRFIGNGGNLDLGLRIVDWLLAEDRFLEVPARVESDLRLELTPRQSGSLGAFWIFFLPTLFGLIGIWRWWVLKHA